MDNIEKSGFSQVVGIEYLELSSVTSRSNKTKKSQFAVRDMRFLGHKGPQTGAMPTIKAYYV